MRIPTTLIALCLVAACSSGGLGSGGEGGGAGDGSFRRRLELFPTVEIACAANPPNRSLPFASLLTAAIRTLP